MKDKKPTSILEFQDYFNNLYGALNGERSWQDIYGYLSRTTGYLTRSTLKKKPEIQDFCRAVSWLFALANKLDVNLQESLFKKYPGICPYCLEATCCCIRTEKKPLKDYPPYKIIEERNAKYDAISRFGNKDFKEAVNVLSKIYTANDSIWHFSGPWMTCSKLFEEVAELHEAISKYLVEEKKKVNVNQEFADVLAWLLTAWNSCFRGKSLDDELISYFYQDCPVCLQFPCVCKTSDSRIQGLVDAKKFSELRSLFEDLEHLTPDAKGELEDLIISLRSVEDTQDEATANATVSKVKQAYDNFMTSLTMTESVANKLSSIYKIIQNF